MSSKFKSKSTVNSSVESQRDHESLKEIINFMETQIDDMLALQIKARKMMDNLFENSDMTTSDVLNNKTYLFPIKIRKAILSHLNKPLYIESSLFKKEFRQLLDLCSRYLEQFRYYSAIVMPLTEEIQELFLTKTERMMLAERLNMFDDSFNIATNLYRSGSLKVSKRTSCKVQN